jgi:hypothetical protein
MNQFAVAQYLSSFGYSLFLLGNNLGLQITPEFFSNFTIGALPSDDLEINGNVLAVHRSHVHPLLNVLLKDFKDCTSQSHFDDHQAKCNPAV